ncbi:hypothetical protein E2320_014214 [Naja naja]|nr:hypothetical protein E2320_014214 [Naja naja]
MPLYRRANQLLPPPPFCTGRSSASDVPSASIAAAPGRPPAPPPSDAPASEADLAGCSKEEMVRRLCREEAEKLAVLVQHGRLIQGMDRQLQEYLREIHELESRQRAAAGCEPEAAQPLLLPGRRTTESQAPGPPLADRQASRGASPALRGLSRVSSGVGKGPFSHFRWARGPRGCPIWRLSHGAEEDSP